MYMPSMFVGGSSLIHLLASNPRVVALFGMGALITTLLQSPFGTVEVMGTAGYVRQLENVARQQGAIDPEVIARAHTSARALAQLPPNRLAEIVEDTLRDCGSACISVRTSAVLKNQEMLGDVLLLHTLNQVSVQRRAAVRLKQATPTAAESPR